MKTRIARTILSGPATGLATALGWLLATVGTGLAQPTLEFTASSISVNEAAGAVTLTVQRQGDRDTEVRVDYATADGTAVAGMKYTPVSGTLAFVAGQTNQTIVVPVLNDGFADGTKTFRVNLSNPTGGAVLGARATATVSITDNDWGIEFRFRSYPPPSPIINYPALTEDVGAVIIGVVRGDDGNLPVTVDWATSDLTATSGLDYTGMTNTLAFAPTERLKFFSVPILNNSLKEGNKTFRVALSNPTGGTLGGTKTTTVTIADNDQGFEFESATYSVAEDAGAVLVRVLRGTDDTNASVTVDYATADGSASSGLDYAATSGTLSFAPGEKVKVVPVPILNDGVKEPTESFRLSLSHPTGGAVLGARTTTTTTIQDNDPGMGFEPGYSAWEKAGEVILTVLRGNDGALGAVTVDYATSDVTAKAGEDYEAVSGTLEFRENETVKTLAIRILPDVAVENTETFRVMLSNATGGAVLGTATATVAIRDNYCTVAPPSDSMLAIRREEGVNILTWAGGGQLQRADRVTGPWQTLTATKGPQMVQPPIPTTFYQIKRPRPVNLFVPSSYNGQSPMPLVILLHGGGQSGGDTEGYMRFLPLAEGRGFLYCYPDGTPFFALAGFGWNATDALSDPATDWGGAIVDDAGYLRDLIGEIGQRFAVDRKRVYVVGHSNGAMMAYRMACQSADLIAGIASLAGPTFLDPSLCVPSEPVNILHIHGTADQTAAYWGGAGTIVGSLNVTPDPGAVRSVQNWAGYNGAHDPVTDPARTLDLTLDVPGFDTVVTRYTQHPPGGAVELWTIEGGVHSPTLSPEFSPRVIDWLLAHRKP